MKVIYTTGIEDVWEDVYSLEIAVYVLTVTKARRIEQYGSLRNG